MKKAICYVLTFLTFLISVLCFTGCGDEGYWTKYFDLSDKKIIWNGLMPDGTEVPNNTMVHNYVWVQLKRSKKSIQLNVEDFYVSNFTTAHIKYLEYCIKPNEEVQLSEGSRQEIYVYLTDIKDDEELKKIVKELEKLCFIKTVCPVITVDNQ